MKKAEFDLWTHQPDRHLQSFHSIQHYLQQEKIPWRICDSGIKESLHVFKPNSMEHPNSAASKTGQKKFPLRDVAILPQKLFTTTLRQRFQDEISVASTSKLYNEDQDASAARLTSTPQKIFIAILLFACGVFAFYRPILFLITINCFATFYFLCAIGFRLFLLSVSFRIPITKHQQTSLPVTISETDLPVITILLPLYDEASSLPLLAEAIYNLDYPEDKLDIKLLLEADDKATQKEARRLGLYRKFDVIIIPPSAPQTKPKACNHGLYTARGSLIVIYDAEDQPEPDQLKKAAIAFANASPDIACLQARLNYYNAGDNWLTRLFALEYSLWFDSLLPALEVLKVPIPLGGTSNFFRTDILMTIGGWDPHNVTEDADLGLRLAARGYRTKILDSTTFEEANCDLRNWLRQRSRWMKGYIQTWFVHMRKPWQFTKTVGFHGFLATQLFVAGNVFSALFNPILWTIFLIWHITDADLISRVFPGPLLWLNLFALLVGNFFFVYLSIIAPLKRGWSNLSPHALLTPIYWLLMAVAAYKAVGQLITRPFYWEKTDHALSATTLAKRKLILRAQKLPYVD